MLAIDIHQLELEVRVASLLCNNDDEEERAQSNVRASQSKANAKCRLVCPLWRLVCAHAIRVAYVCATDWATRT